MIQKIKFFNNDLVFALNKPILLTSNQVIQLIKKYSSFDKIGHSGTLDPSASGVLVVCTNKKTKFLNFIFDKNKRYLVFFIIGVESDSLDIFGKVKYFCLDKIKIEKKIAKFFISSVKRNYIQTPPGYSSIKHHGYSLYKYSRLEIKLHLKTDVIKIYKLFLVHLIGNIVIIDIECSKGTYVREIVKFLSLKINLPLSVCNIIRLKISNYSILDSVSFF